MGVKDLWQLLSPIGRRVSVETLEGKTLAIDVSIWITQFIKAMRDEDGKMAHNAHLIGTIRRILKLLFHRIRPLFVFDGATPALKLKTVKARRKSQDNHVRFESLIPNNFMTSKQDTNKRSAAQRILLAQLKQHAISSAMHSSEISDSASSSSNNVARNFNPGPSLATHPTQTTQSASFSVTSSATAADGAAELSDSEDVQWVAGYEGLRAKKLAAGEDDEDLDASQQEEEFHWRLPEDHSQIDVEALSAMPAHIRKGLVEEARRKERARSRATYLHVAANPALYSQTQLSNFLNTR